MIDVIIPAYNSHQTIEQTLCSIAYQDMVDKLEVYIVNDCSDEDYGKEVEYFSNFMKIKEIKLEKNSGPGVARQCGIDNSKNEFIVFIDSDDVFADCFAIKNLFNSIQDYDVVISKFVEENDNDSFYSHDDDRIWLHGKMYRRSFLENNNIRFNDTRANEDNGFNQLVFLNDSRVNVISNKTYIWRNNSNSITRSNNREYKYTGLKGYIYNIIWALKKADENKCNYVKISDLALSALLASYYYYLECGNQFKKDKLFSLLVELKDISDRYPPDEERRLDIFEIQYKCSLNAKSRKYMLNPKVTFNDFLKIIDKKGGSDI